MTRGSYSVKVEKELHRLTQLAQTRCREIHLQSILATITRWQNGEVSADMALEEISELTVIKEPHWSEEADPGVPVAQALADSVLRREDVDEGAWRSIEYLVALIKL